MLWFRESLHPRSSIERVPMFTGGWFLIYSLAAALVTLAISALVGYWLTRFGKSIWAPAALMLGLWVVLLLVTVVPAYRYAEKPNATIPLLTHHRTVFSVAGPGDLLGISSDSQYCTADAANRAADNLHRLTDSGHDTYSSVKVLPARVTVWRFSGHIVNIEGDSGPACRKN
jgi:hypothetical protein